MTYGARASVLPDDPRVAPAEVSGAAKAKAASKRTPDWLPAHSFTTLLAGLGTVTMNWMVLSSESAHEIPVLAERTPLQRRAFEMLGAGPQNMFPRQAHPQITEKPRAAGAFLVLCP